jgi:hypothetical protein
MQLHTPGRERQQTKGQFASINCPLGCHSPPPVSPQVRNGLRAAAKQPANVGLFTASGATRFHINDIAHLVLLVPCMLYLFRWVFRVSGCGSSFSSRCAFCRSFRDTRLSAASRSLQFKRSLHLQFFQLTFAPPVWLDSLFQLLARIFLSSQIRSFRRLAH